MNFSSMEYFAVLARERSFTRAAERLHITQQSLSSHIAGLEKELGCQLLVRRAPLSLTYAGEVFLRYAASFRQAETAMRREFCDISRDQKGVLRVGAAAARGRALLPRAVAAFQKTYPNIRVELTEGANDVLCRLLERGELDLAVAAFPESLPKIRLRDFYREEVVLLLRRGLLEETFGAEAGAREAAFRAGDLRALGECPVVLGGPEDIDGRIGRAVLRDAGIGEPRLRAVSHNVGMLLSLCAEGAGACFCPEGLARSLLPEAGWADLLAFPLGERARYWIRFGYRAESYQWSVLEAFMDRAAACAGRG